MKLDVKLFDKLYRNCKSSYITKLSSSLEFCPIKVDYIVDVTGSDMRQEQNYGVGTLERAKSHVLLHNSAILVNDRLTKQNESSFLPFCKTTACGVRLMVSIGA